MWGRQGNQFESSSEVQNKNIYVLSLSAIVIEALYKCMHKWSCPSSWNSVRTLCVGTCGRRGETKEQMELRMSCVSWRSAPKEGAGRSVLMQGVWFYPTDGCVPGQGLCRSEERRVCFTSHRLLAVLEVVQGVKLDVVSAISASICCSHLWGLFCMTWPTKPAALCVLLSSESFFTCFCPKSIHIIHICPSLCPGWKACAVSVAGAWHIAVSASDGEVAGSAWQGSTVEQQPASSYCGFVRDDGMLLFEQRDYFPHIQRKQNASSRSCCKMLFSYFTKPYRISTKIRVPCEQGVTWGWLL